MLLFGNSIRTGEQGLAGPWYLDSRHFKAEAFTSDLAAQLLNAVR